METSAGILAARKRSRENTVDLGEGRKVFFLRPTEAELPSLLTVDGDKARWSIEIEHVRKYVYGWEGFSGATFLGAALESTEPIEFSPALWDDWCSDCRKDTVAVADAILNSVITYIQQRDAIAKNSEPA